MGTKELKVKVSHLLNFFLTIELFDSGIPGSLPAQMGPKNEFFCKKLHSNVFLYIEANLQFGTCHVPRNQSGRRTR